MTAADTAAADKTWVGYPVTVAEHSMLTTALGQDDRLRAARAEADLAWDAAVAAAGRFEDMAKDLAERLLGRPLSG